MRTVKIYIFVILTFLLLPGCPKQYYHPIEKTEEWQAWERLEELHKQLEQEE